MLLQTEQRRRLALTSRTAVARRFGVFIAGAEDVEGEALRALCANAGSFFSSSIRRDMGSANLDIGILDSWNFVIEKLNPAATIVNAGELQG